MALMLLYRYARRRSRTRSTLALALLRSVCLIIPLRCHKRRDAVWRRALVSAPLSKVRKDLRKGRCNALALLRSVCLTIPLRRHMGENIGRALVSAPLSKVRKDLRKGCCNVLALLRSVCLTIPLHRHMGENIGRALMLLYRRARRWSRIRGKRLFFEVSIEHVFEIGIQVSGALWIRFIIFKTY